MVRIGMADIFNFDTSRLTVLEAGHGYRWDGNRVPFSATGVIGACGLYKSLQFISDEQRDAGTRVHDLIEMALRFGMPNAIAALVPDEATVVKAQAALDCIRDAGITVDHVECPLYHEAYNVCGCADLVGRVGAGYCVVDWKSGGVQPATALQLALYAGCLKNPRMVRRIAIGLAGGKYHVHEFPVVEFHRDITDFAACLRVLGIRQRFGIQD
jgi:hypothetical protein